MDTKCARCLRNGPFQERFQCERCQRILLERSCPECTPATAIQTQAPGLEAPDPRAGAIASIDGPRPLPDIRKSEPPAWLVACVGGVAFGAGLGAVVAHFMDMSWLIGGGIGAAVGAILGPLLGGGSK